MLEPGKFRIGRFDGVFGNTDRFCGLINTGKQELYLFFGIISLDDQAWQPVQFPGTGMQRQAGTKPGNVIPAPEMRRRLLAFQTALGRRIAGHFPANHGQAFIDTVLVEQPLDANGFLVRGVDIVLGAEFGGRQTGGGITAQLPFLLLVDTGAFTRQQDHVLCKGMRWIVRIPEMDKMIVHHDLGRLGPLRPGAEGCCQQRRTHDNQSFHMRFFLNKDRQISGPCPHFCAEQGKMYMRWLRDHKKGLFIPAACRQAPPVLTLCMRRNKTSYIVERLIHAIFWLAVFYALKALTANAFQLFSRDRDNLISQDGQLPFPYAWIVLLCLMVLFYSSSLWLLPRTRKAGLLAGWLILIYGLDYAIIRFLAKPAGTVLPPGPKGPLPGLPPLPAFTTVHWSNLQPVLALIFLLVMGLAAAYYYIGESVRQQLLRSETELKFLRSQVNPHFLFNTLNNLFSLAQRDGSEELADKIVRLSGMMRYMLYDSNAAQVPLAQEITYLQDCIALYRLRLASEASDIRFEYPEPLPEIAVAPMLLIPFVENAFKHGWAAGQPSHIRLSLTLENRQLRFRCENSDHSQWKRPAGEQGGIGLENVRRRLEWLYRRKYSLRTGTAQGNYLVDLQIDLS